jgi:DNA-directed RNA polymerase subunit F
VFETKKLFLLTCNKEQLIDENMVNRPGRIYYLKRFQGLEMDFVKEYFEDNLNNKSLINDLLIKIALISPVNFDSLKAIVEECNRYEDIPDIRDILNLLNVGQNINATYVCYIALPGEDEWHRIGTLSNIMSSKVILYSVNKIVDTLDKSKFSNHHVLSNTDIASDDDDYHDNVDPNEVNLSNINEALVKYKKFIKNLNEEDKINLIKTGHAFHKSDIKHIDLSGDIIFENSQGFKLKAEKMSYSSNGYRDFL